MPAPAHNPPAIVLDTNVVLDCLLFRDPRCARLVAALEARRVRWIATASMREELGRVLEGSSLQQRVEPRTEVWQGWSRLCCEIDPLPPLAGFARPRCTDPDDQIFIDAALGHGARWLLSRDRAVLKLARRMRDAGVEVTSPQTWQGSGTRA